VSINESKNAIRLALRMGVAVPFLYFGIQTTLAQLARGREQEIADSPTAAPSVSASRNHPQGFNRIPSM
jgi:hypothetical protein